MIEVLPDIPRLLTAVAEWLACVGYVLLVPRRFGWIATGALLAAGFGALVLVQTLVDRLPLELWTLGMLIAVGTMLGVVGAITRVGPSDGVYVLVRAFVLAELAASLEWQVHAYYFQGDLLWSPGAIAFLVASFAVLFGGAYLLERRHFSPAQPPRIEARTLAGAIALVVITFAMSNLSFVISDTPFSGEVSTQVFYIRTLVDLCGYIALYAQHEQLRKRRADADLAEMNAMLHTQHEQYLQSKRDTEHIQRTYHDLKHQVAAIRAELDPARRAAHLAELERSINAYGATYDTGNPVLDTVLTAKTRQCLEQGITLTAVADGSLLGFVEAMDLAAILGNALDNALEAAMRLADPEQRLVKCAVSTEGPFVVIRLENYFDGKLRYVQSELATRKPDRRRHGIGLKSIRHAAQKYGGQVAIAQRGNWFTLSVLLPSPH